MALRWLDRPSLIVGGSVLACAASALRASSAGGGPLAQALGDEQVGRVLAGLKGLPGWSGLTAEQLEVDVVQGGLTNQLYKLSRSGSGTPVDPVLLRIYGLGTDDFFCREEEIAAFEALSAVGAGPRCFGVFPGGRLEQFLNGRTLAREDVKDPSISDQIAIAMAKFHTSNPAIAGSREPALVGIVAKWLEAAKLKLSELARSGSAEDRAIIAASTVDTSPDALDREFAELKRALAGAKSPIAFTHNDLINGNLMEVEGEVRLIDFEYGFFAHSAHDIGNHFLEWTINYEFPEPPLYEIRHEDYPSEAQQRRFVRSYLTARGEGAVSDAAVEAFVAESKLFTMASHFMWACWGLVQAGQSEIDFGYLQYGIDRFEGYMYRKKLLQ